MTASDPVRPRPRRRDVTGRAPARPGTQPGAGGLAILAALALAAPRAAAQDTRVVLEPGTSRSGPAYSAGPASGAEPCLARCQASVRCDAFTFTGGTCRLLEGAGQASDDAAATSGIRAPLLRLTVVSANMMGSGNLFGLGPRSLDGWVGTARAAYGVDLTGFAFEDADWATRADRLAESIARSRPEIVSLTEVEGWRWCSPGTGATVGDYQLHDRLIQRLAQLTGITYRVAYMVGIRGAFGAFQQCRYFTGDSVLYDPTRLVNRGVDDVVPQQQDHESTLAGYQQRRSLPICDGTARPEVKELIDGAPQSDKCSDRPSGPAWAWTYRSARGDLSLAASAARFSFRHDPRRSFDVFTLHPMAGAADVDPAMPGAYADFTTALTTAPRRTDLAYYPPLLLGDLNALAGDPRSIPGFTEVFGGGGDVMVVRVGDAATFPAAHGLEVVTTRYLPDDPREPFADHLGLLVSFAWRSPPPAVSPGGGGAGCSGCNRAAPAMAVAMGILVVFRRRPRGGDGRGGA